ncbi:MAG: PKD domain-containing protein [Deltaproteobacteria bacterium]|nr:PKD domain-containing protein [Deltaproteobacteria bacterium]
MKRWLLPGLYGRLAREGVMSQLRFCLGGAIRALRRLSSLATIAIAAACAGPGEDRAARSEPESALPIATTQLALGPTAGQCAPDLCPVATATRTCGGCFDPIDLVARKTYNPSTWYDDHRCYCRPMRFTVPQRLDVTAGNGGNHWCDLYFRDPATGTTHSCRYKGGASQAHPNSPSQIALGLFYNFLSCTNGMVPGSVAGADYIRLRVANGDSYLAVTEVRVTLREPTGQCAGGPTPPVITSTAGTAASVGVEYSYAVTATDADPGDVLTFALTNAPGGMSIDSTGLVTWTPTVAPVAPVPVQVAVTDHGGRCTTQSFDIAVSSGGPTNHLPVIGSTAPASAREGELYLYVPSLSDPDGDPLTLLLDQGPAGMFALPLLDLVFWIPGEDQLGSHLLRIQVADGRGGFAMETATVTVENAPDAPVFVSTPPTSAQQGVAFNYQAIVADSDQGDTATFALVSGAPGMTIGPASGLLSFSPSNAEVGGWIVEIRAVDSDGLSATQRFTLEVLDTNEAPAFASDPISQVEAGVPYLYQPVVTDPDPFEAVLFTLNAGPPGLELDPLRGRLSWPSPIAGTYVVDLSVTDLGGLSDRQIFSLEVDATNHAPVITSTPPLGATVGVALVYQVTVSDDPGDTHRFSVLSGPPGITVDALQGVLQWVPTGFTGTATITLRVVDQAGASAEQAFALEVLPPATPPPVAQFVVGRGRNVTRAEDGGSIAFISSGTVDDAKGAISDEKSNASGWRTTSSGDETLRAQFFDSRLEVVDRMEIEGRSSNVGARQIELWLSTSTAAGAVFDRVLSATVPRESKRFTYPFPPTHARQAELHVRDNYGGIRIEVPHFAVRNRPKQGGIVSQIEGGAEPLRATSGFATAANAFDFDDGRSWRATPPAPQSVTLALSVAAPVPIDEIFFDNPRTTSHCRAFELRASGAGSADSDFSVAVSDSIEPFRGTSLPAFGVRFVFPPVLARYVQLVCLSGYLATSGPTVTDAEIYSPSLGGPEVAFDNFSDVGGSLGLSYEWDFGDDSTSSEPHPVHRYHAPGTYLVTLTARDAAGRASVATAEYTALAPPVAAFRYSPRPVLEADLVSFENESFAPGGTIVGVRRNRSDDPTPVTEYSSTHSQPFPGWTDTFVDQGQVTVTLDVVDSQRLEATYSKVITIDDKPPVINAGPPQDLYWGEPWKVVPSSTDVPVDRGTLVCTWEFGDDTPPESVQRCVGSDANAVVHRYDHPGNYVAHLLVTDDAGVVSDSVLDVAVYKRSSSIFIAGTSTASGPTNATVEVQVVDGFDGRGRLGGLWVSVEAGSFSAQVLTDESGLARAEVPFVPFAPLTVDAAFSGNDDYLGSAGIATFDAFDPSGRPVAPGGEAWSGNEGSEFVLAFTRVTIESPAEEDWLLQLQLSSRVPVVATVANQQYGTAQVPIYPGAVSKLNIPFDFVDQTIDGGLRPRGAFRVTAPAPISVAQLQGQRYALDSALLLPVQALGTRYRTPNGPVFFAARTPHIGHNSRLVAVGLEDNTTLTVYPKAPSIAFHQGAGLFSRSTPFTVVMNRHDMIEMFSTPQEVTGTLVESDRPIGFYGSNAATPVPVNVAAANSLLEHVPPKPTWGKHFLVVPFAGRESGSFVRVVADESTEVRRNGVVVATLAPGEWWELDQPQTSFDEIETSAPALVYQLTKGVTAEPDFVFDQTIGDPTMTLVVPTEQFGTRYTVQAFDGFPALFESGPAVEFQSFVNVIAPTSSVSGMLVDNLPVSEAWTPIGTGEYAVASIPVSAGAHQVRHVLPNTRFGVYVYGFAPADAYAMPGGMQVAPLYSACVPQTVAMGDGLDNDCDGRIDEELADAIDDDRDGLTDEDTSPAPVASLHAPVALSRSYTLEEGLPSGGIVLAAFDADGDALRFDLEAAPAHGTLHVFDANQALAVGPVLTATADVGSIVQYLPEVGYLGPDELRFRARDGIFASNTGTVSFTVVRRNHRPRIISTAPVEAYDGVPYVYTLVATDEDPGDTVHYAKLVGPEGMTISSTTGAVSWVPTEDDIGSHAISFGAIDTAGAMVTESFHVMVFDINHAPVITSTAPQVAHVGAELVYPVIAFDEDHNDTVRFTRLVGPSGASINYTTGVFTFRPRVTQVGTHVVSIEAKDSRDTTGVQTFVLEVRPANRAPLFVSSPVTVGAPFFPYQYDAIVADADSAFGDTLSYGLTVSPAAMSVSPVGAVTWTPALVDLGSHEVRLVATDQAGTAAAQGWYLDVRSQNSPPAIVSAPRQLAIAGEVFTDQVVSEDPDAGDVPVFELVTGPPGMVVSASGAITWSPQDSDLGTVQVVLQATDREGATDLQAYSVAVEAENFAPTITSAAILSATQNQPYRYQLVVSDPNSADRFSFEVVAGPAGMTVGRSGLVSWTPSPLQVAPQAVELRVTDLGGLTTTQSFTIVVLNVNDPPVVSSAPVTSAEQDVIYSYHAAASDFDAGDAARFVLERAPAGMTVDPSSGLVSWTPTFRQVGSEGVVLRVFDRAGASTAQSFTIAVANRNDPPEITSHADGTVVQGETFAYQVRVSDPDPGDTASYSLDFGPSGMGITSGGGLVSWTPSVAQIGVTTYRVRVTDGGGVSRVQTSTLTVIEDSVPPRVTVSFTPKIVNPGQASVLAVSATDNASVAFVGLTVNGAGVALDANRSASFVPGASGVYEAVATVRDGAGNETVATARLGARDGTDVTAPAVLLSEPVADQQVLMPITVTGSVSDAHLLEYALLLRSESEGGWVTLSSGAAAGPGGVLGTVDPTLLENGIYLLRLEATDISGNTTAEEVPIEVHGEAKIGLFRLSFIDLQVPVVGIPITVTRTYDSRIKVKRDFGVGWDLEVTAGKFENNRTPGVDWSIHENFPPPSFPCSVVDELHNHLTSIRLSDREWYSFAPTLVNVASGLGGCFADVSFVQVDGWSVGATLDVLGNTSVFQLSGTTDLQDELTLQPFDPQVVMLTTPDGRMITLERGKGITHVEDLNGNELTIGPNGLSHNAGASITFVRDGQGRITEITDPMGHTLEYGYSAAGDLVSFKDQEKNEARFTYDDRHNLVDIIDPLGVRATRQEYDESGRLVATIDPFGNRYVFNHDLANRREAVTNRLGYTVFYDFDTAGNVVQETYPGTPTVLKTRSFDARHNVLSETNENGETTRWSYDARNNKLTESNPLAETSTWTYSSFNKVTSWTDPLGNAVTSQFDARGNRIFETDQEGFSTTFTVDTKGNTIRECDPRGYCRRMLFDTLGRISKSTDKRGVPTVFTYDLAGRTLTETATRSVEGVVESLVTRHAYDAVGREIETEYADGAIERTEYDVRGLMTARIDPLGRRTETVYDESGRAIETRYADGTSERTDFDSEDQVVGWRDRVGRQRSVRYDDRGRLVEVGLGDGLMSYVQYDGVGLPVATTNRRGFTTTRVFDAAGRTIERRDALNHASRRSYDRAGRLVSTSDAKNRTASLAYDRRGLLTTTQLPDGTTTRSQYDAAGNEVGRVDQENRRTSYTFDGEGNLTSVTSPNNEIWFYGFDEQANLVSQTDPLGHTTRFAFDKRGRETSRQYAIGAPQQRQYDLAGNLIQRTNHSGAVTGYQFDVNDRLVTRIQPEGAASMTWSPTGRRLTASDARGLTTKTYDALDRLSSETDPSGYSLTYQRDAEGNITSMTAVVGATSWTETYGFDALNRQTSVTAEGQTFQLVYDETDQLSELHYPNGLVTTYSRDEMDRLTSIVTRNAQDEVVLGFEYTRSPAGNIITQTEVDGRIREFSYDLADRLTEAVVRTATAVLFAEGFDYDGAGNRLVRLYSEASGAPETAISSYDERDRLLTAAGDVLEWDEDGRLLRRSGADAYSLTWDSEDRLLAMSRGDGSSLQNTYDVDGVRVRSEAVPAIGSADVANLVVSKERWLSHVVAEAEAGDGALRARYIRAGDQLLAVLRGGERRFYHADQVGSVRALSDESGSLRDSYDYLAFGGLRGHAGSDVSPYLFAGEAFDARGILSANRARWFDPTVGAFLSADPWPGSAQAPRSLHRYAYAFGNPVTGSDPSGLMTLVEVQQVVAQIATLSRVTVNVLTFVQRAQSLMDIVDVAENLAKMASIGMSYEDVLPDARKALAGLDLDDAMTVLAHNIPRMMTEASLPWTQYLAIKKRGNVSAFLVYLPNPGLLPQIKIATPLKIGRRKVKLVAGGTRTAGHITGVGLEVLADPPGEHQVWRMDYHPWHGSAAAGGVGTIGVWREGPYHFHVLKPPR